MKKEISVFELFKNYITEILRECNVIDENQKNIRINTIIQDILDMNEVLDGQEWECAKLKEKIIKSRKRGNVIQVDWEQLIRNKVHINDADSKDRENKIASSNEEFFALLEVAIDSSMNVGQLIDNNIGHQIETYLTKRIESYLGYKVFDKNMPILAKVYVFFIHGLYGNVKAKVPHEANVPYLNRATTPAIETDWKFVWVVGPAYSGKTRLLVEYAQRNNKSVVYCRNPESYDEIINQIVFEEDDVLNDDLRVFLGCRRRSDLKIEERIGSVLKEFILIVDGGRINDGDLEKLVQLSKADKIQIFVEARSDDRITVPDTHVIYVKPFTSDEAFRLFYWVGEQNGEGQEREKNAELDKILPDVCRAGCNNPTLVILLAKHYWWSIDPNNKNRDEEKAFEFLQNVVSFRPVGKVDKRLRGQKYYLPVDYGKKGGKEQVQVNVLGHIRNLFEMNVTEKDKSAFYVLALLDGIELKLIYLTNWFRIDESTIQEWERAGWCTIDDENLRIGIPHLIIRAFGKDEYKNVAELRIFKEYITNLSQTLWRLEIDPIDVETMQKVILRLHNIFFIQLKDKKTLVDQTLCEFHFSCIRYFLYYGNAVQAGQLESIVNFDKIEGSSIYQDTLNKIRDYIGKNEMETIVDDIIDIVQNGEIFQSDLAVRAFADMVYLFTERLFLEGVKSLMEFNESCEVYVWSKDIILSLIPIYYLIYYLTGLDDIFSIVGMLSYTYVRPINCSQQMFDIVHNKEKHWDEIQGKYDSLDNNVCNVEKKIYVKSVVLIMYELLYKYMYIILDKRNKTNKEKIIEDSWRNELSEILSDITNRIQEIAEQLKVLKKRVGELPCNCAGMCLLASAIAGVILQDKSLMQVSDYDFKHLTLYDEQEQKRLKDIIFNCRKWGMKEEE